MVAGLDRQGSITVIAGLLIALITLFTSPSSAPYRIDQQIGIPLLLASLATLVVDAQLATRRRSRNQSDPAREADRRDRERLRADRERNRAAEERERALHRDQRQARCTVVQFRYLLAPTPANARPIADLIALLEGYGDLA